MLLFFESFFITVGDAKALNKGSSNGVAAGVSPNGMRSKKRKSKNDAWPSRNMISPEEGPKKMKKEQEKPCRCNSCGKEYKTMGNLNRHQNIECGKDPQFECNVCGNKFVHKYKCFPKQSTG